MNIQEEYAEVWEKVMNLDDNLSRYLLAFIFGYYEDGENRDFLDVVNSGLDLLGNKKEG